MQKSLRVYYVPPRCVLDIVMYFSAVCSGTVKITQESTSKHQCGKIICSSGLYFLELSFLKQKGFGLKFEVRPTCSHPDVLFCFKYTCMYSEIIFVINKQVLKQILNKFKNFCA